MSTQTNLATNRQWHIRRVNANVKREIRTEAAKYEDRGKDVGWVIERLWTLAKAHDLLKELDRPQEATAGPAE